MGSWPSAAGACTVPPVADALVYLASAHATQPVGLGGSQTSTVGLPPATSAATGRTRMSRPCMNDVCGCVYAPSSPGQSRYRLCTAATPVSWAERAAV